MAHLFSRLASAWNDWRRPSTRSHILRFLGARRPGDIRRHDRTLPRYHEADVYRALEHLRAAHDLTVETVGLDGLTNRTGNVVQRPTLGWLAGAEAPPEFGSVGSSKLSTGPGTDERFPTNALFLISSGPRRMVLRPWSSSDFTSMDIEAATGRDPADAAWASGLLDALEERAVAHSMLRGRILRPVCEDGETEAVHFLEPPPRATIRLAPQISAEIASHFTDHLVHRERLKAAGIHARRGLLMCGEPGTGKSSACHLLKHDLPDHTFVVVGADAVYHVAAVFRFARRLAPAVIVLEDVDLVIPARDTTVVSGPLRELLNEIDGLGSAGDLALILTANTPELLESALVERPGRVDHVVRFEKPDRAHRRTLLASLTGAMRVEADLEALAADTDGFTPARLAEVVKRAALASLKRSDDLVLAQPDVSAALASLTRVAAPRSGRRPIGLAAVPRAS